MERVSPYNANRRVVCSVLRDAIKSGFSFVEADPQWVVDNIIDYHAGCRQIGKEEVLEHVNWWKSLTDDERDGIKRHVAVKFSPTGKVSVGQPFKKHKDVSLIPMGEVSGHIVITMFPDGDFDVKKY